MLGTEATYGGMNSKTSEIPLSAPSYEADMYAVTDPGSIAR